MHHSEMLPCRRELLLLHRVLLLSVVRKWDWVEWGKGRGLGGGDVLALQGVFCKDMLRSKGGQGGGGGVGPKWNEVRRYF